MRRRGEQVRPSHPIAATSRCSQIVLSKQRRLATQSTSMRIPQCNTNHRGLCGGSCCKALQRRGGILIPIFPGHKPQFSRPKKNDFSANSRVCTVCACVCVCVCIERLDLQDLTLALAEAEVDQAILRQLPATLAPPEPACLAASRSCWCRCA